MNLPEYTLWIPSKSPFLDPLEGWGLFLFDSGDVSFPQGGPHPIYPPARCQWGPSHISPGKSLVLGMKGSTADFYLHGPPVWRSTVWYNLITDLQLPNLLFLSPSTGIRSFASINTHNV